MTISQARAIAWKVRSRAARYRRRQGLPARHRWIIVPALPLLALAVAHDASALQVLLDRFSLIHMTLSAAIFAGFAYLAVFVLSGVAGVFLTLAQSAPGLVLGASALGVLPFAQATDPSPANPARGSETSLAHSEMQLGLYLGRSSSPNSDVHLKSPDGTDMTIRDIKWKSESFKPSPYYGGRGIDWNARFPRLGVMVDFTHAKATAIRSQTVTQEGVHKGEQLPPSGPLSKIFRKLEFTHGLNFLTLNGVYRVTGLNRRLVPYVGLGFGFMVPHADAWRAGQQKKDRIHGAQVTGIAAQLISGIEWRVFKSDRRSLFTEYKLTYTTNDVTLKDGGSVATNIWIHQFNFGGYYTPWRAGDAALRQAR